MNVRVDYLTVSDACIFTQGKVYEVIATDFLNNYYVIADNGEEWFLWERQVTVIDE